MLGPAALAARAALCLHAVPVAQLSAVRGQQSLLSGKCCPGLGQVLPAGKSADSKKPLTLNPNHKP